MTYISPEKLRTPEEQAKLEGDIAREEFISFWGYKIALPLTVLAALIYFLPAPVLVFLLVLVIGMVFFK